MSDARRPLPVCQKPSTSTSRPSSRRRPTQLARAATGSARAQSTCRQSTTSYAPRSNGGSPASPTAKVRSGRAAAFSRAASTISGEKSTPSTAYPSSASRTLSEPVPQPRSATRAGGSGRWSRRRLRQASRTDGSRSPWSGSSSNVAASASQNSLTASSLLPGLGAQRAEVALQLVQRVGLDQVGVGARRKAGQPVLLRVARGAQNHGDAREQQADPVQRLEPVVPRQHHVEHHDVGRPLGRAGHALRA